MTDAEVKAMLVGAAQASGWGNDQMLAILCEFIACETETSQEFEDAYVAFIAEARRTEPATRAPAEPRRYLACDGTPLTRCPNCDQALMNIGSITIPASPGDARVLRTELSSAGVLGNAGSAASADRRLDARCGFCGYELGDHEELDCAA